MGRTFALSFWISSLTVISLSEAGIPLSLRCSSRPFFSTFSRSSAEPFLSAAPYLTFVPILPASIPDSDVDYTPDLPEKTSKTIVILHKMHRNNDNNIEIIITNKRKEPTDQSNECIENDEDDTSMNHYDAKNSNEEKSESEIPADEGESLEQDDEIINNNLVKKDTSTVEHAKEVLSDKESELNKAEDDSITEENY